jgi:hypothetical protein
MNQVILIIAMLTHLELITKDQAKQLVQNLRYSTIPDDYEQCHKIIADLFNKAEINVKKELKDVLVDGKKVTVKK